MWKISVEQRKKVVFYNIERRMRANKMTWEHLRVCSVFLSCPSFLSAFRITIFCLYAIHLACHFISQPTVWFPFWIYNRSTALNPIHDYHSKIYPQPLDWTKRYKLNPSINLFQCLSTIDLIVCAANHHNFRPTTPSLLFSALLHNLQFSTVEKFHHVNIQYTPIREIRIRNFSVGAVTFCFSPFLIAADGTANQNANTKTMAIGSDWFDCYFRLWLLRTTAKTTLSIFHCSLKLFLPF